MLWYGWALRLGLLHALLPESPALAVTLSPNYGRVSGRYLEEREGDGEDQSLSISSTSISRRIENSTSVQLFKTEPLIEQLTFEYLRLTSNPSLLAPGYLFFTIQSQYEHVQASSIYDTIGNLIWFKHRGVQTQDLHPCDYLGERGTHLCLHLWLPRRKEILNQNYKLVWKQYSGLSDSHEFNVLPGGYSFLVVGGQRKKFDLTPYTGSSEGYVHDACLMEFDIKTHKLLYKWCYLDHNLPIWATHLWMKLDGPLGEVNGSMASDKAGKGTKDDPWSFTHVNAGDKADGDYFMSIRFLDQIIKFAGPHNRHGVEPGTVLWRLGGTGSDFDIPPNLNFTRQHHVRVHSVTPEYTILSIFNNGWEGTNQPSVNASSGMVIGINNKTMTAELIQSYPHPDGIIAESRGSMQVLPNNNVLVGYGRAPEVIEHDRNGTILAHLRFTRFKHQEPFTFKNKGYSYRIVKQNWTGLSEEPPKAIAYARTCTIDHSSPLVVYVSWNGATEASSWRFRVGATARGPWIDAGTFQRTGFETQAQLQSVRGKAGTTKHVLVEALDARQQILGHTQAKLFVPKNPKASSCDKHGCNHPMPYKYNQSKSLSCPVGVTVTLKLFIGVALFLEVASLLYVLMWYLLWDCIAPRASGGVYEQVKDLNGHISELDMERKPRRSGREAEHVG